MAKVKEKGNRKDGWSGHLCLWKLLRKVGTTTLNSLRNRKTHPSGWGAVTGEPRESRPHAEFAFL